MARGGAPRARGYKPHPDIAPPLHCLHAAWLPPPRFIPPLLLRCRALQDELHKRYRHGSALQMMCWMNFW